MTEQSTDELDEERADLHELMVRGDEYRKTKEFEYLGAKTDVIMQAMITEDALPLTTRLHAVLDMEVEEAREEVEEAKDDDGTIDVEKLDAYFVKIMRAAARHSIDRDANGWTEEQFTDIVGSDPFADGVADVPARDRSGFIVELGMAGLELSGTLEDAKSFRSRGAQ